MKIYIFRLSLILLSSVLFLSIGTKRAWAQSCYGFKITSPTGALEERTFSEIKFEYFVKDLSSKFLVIPANDSWPYRYDSGYLPPETSGKIAPEKAITNSNLIKEGTYTLIVKRQDIPRDYCLFSYTVLPVPPELRCVLTSNSTGSPGYKPDNNISVHGVKLPYKNTDYLLVVQNGANKEFRVGGETTFNIDIGKLNEGLYRVSLSRSLHEGSSYIPVSECGSVAFTISESGGNSEEPEETPTSLVKKLCGGETGSCAECVKSGKAWTALGCLPTNDLNEFAGWILSKVIFVASGIAFLLMAFGAFQVITSAGDPKKMQAGKELITSALSGLLFIILSIFLLKLIGVDILKIPGFTTKPKSSYF